MSGNPNPGLTKGQRVVCPWCLTAHPFNGHDSVCLHCDRMRARILVCIRSGSGRVEKYVANRAAVADAAPEPKADDASETKQPAPNNKPKGYWATVFSAITGGVK